MASMKALNALYGFIRVSNTVLYYFFLMRIGIFRLQSVKTAFNTLHQVR